MSDPTPSRLRLIRHRHRHLQDLKAEELGVPRYDQPPPPPNLMKAMMRRWVYQIAWWENRPSDYDIYLPNSMHDLIDQRRVPCTSEQQERKFVIQRPPFVDWKVHYNRIHRQLDRWKINIVNWNGRAPDEPKYYFESDKEIIDPKKVVNYYSS